MKLPTELVIQLCFCKSFITNKERVVVTLGAKAVSCTSFKYDVIFATLIMSNGWIKAQPALFMEVKAVSTTH